MWHRKPWAGLAIRLCGALLVAAAALAARRLFLDPVAVVPGHSAPIYALALAFFLSASTGGAMLAHGAHLFDPVEIAPRWRRLAPLPPAEADRRDATMNGDL